MDVAREENFVAKCAAANKIFGTTASKQRGWNCCVLAELGVRYLIKRQSGNGMSKLATESR